MASSARPIGRVWQLIPRENPTRIALGIRLLYVSVVCPGGRIGSRTEGIGGCVPSNVPVDYLKLKFGESKV